MKLEDIPQKALSHTGCAIGGFLIALWCQEASLAEQNYRKFKPGFTMTLESNNGDINDRAPETADGLALVSQNRTDLCQWSFSGVLIRRRKKFIQVTGGIESLESAARLAQGITSGYMKATTQKDAERLTQCRELPLISYGPHP